MSGVQIPKGWRLYKPDEKRATGDKFCIPKDPQDYSQIENWYDVGPESTPPDPLVPDFVYIKPVEKSFDEKFVESLRKFAAQLDAMIKDIQDRIQ